MIRGESDTHWLPRRDAPVLALHPILPSQPFLRSSFQASPGPMP